MPLEIIKNTLIFTCRFCKIATLDSKELINHAKTETHIMNKAKKQWAKPMTSAEAKSIIDYNNTKAIVRRFTIRMRTERRQARRETFKKEYPQYYRDTMTDREVKDGLKYVKARGKDASVSDMNRLKLKMECPQYYKDSLTDKEVQDRLNYINIKGKPQNSTQFDKLGFLLE